MNREIKFRAWGMITKTMIGAESDMWDDISMSGFMHGTGSIIYMQFTGLHDKNGKEIYEGDIIECEYYAGLLSTESLDASVWRGVVQYGSDASFHVIRSSPESRWLAGDCYAVRCGGSAIKRWEVIGNIYENPELLEASP